MPGDTFEPTAPIEDNPIPAWTLVSAVSFVTPLAILIPKIVGISILGISQRRLVQPVRCSAGVVPLGVEQGMRISISCKDAQSEVGVCYRIAA